MIANALLMWALNVPESIAIFAPRPAMSPAPAIAATATAATAASRPSAAASANFMPPADSWFAFAKSRSDCDAAFSSRFSDFRSSRWCAISLFSRLTSATLPLALAFICARWRAIVASLVPLICARRSLSDVLIARAGPLMESRISSANDIDSMIGTTS